MAGVTNDSETVYQSIDTTDYNYIVYRGRKSQDTLEDLYARPLLNSTKLANEFLAMQYGTFIDENDEVILSLNSEEENDISDSLKEFLAGVSCMQLGEDDAKTLDADYFTQVAHMKMVCLNIEPGIEEIVLQNRCEDGEVIKQSPNPIKIIFDPERDFQSNKLVFIIDTAGEIKNLSPTIHEFSNIPHNDILEKIVTVKAIDSALHTEIITGTFNNQAEIKLNDKLEDYTIKITPSYSVHKGNLLINGNKVHGKCN